MFQKSIELIDCQSLYNHLNEGIELSRLTDPYYLYLLGKFNRKLWDKAKGSQTNNYYNKIAETVRTTTKAT